MRLKGLSAEGLGTWALAIAVLVLAMVLAVTAPRYQMTGSTRLDVRTGELAQFQIEQVWAEDHTDWWYGYKRQTR